MEIAGFNYEFVIASEKGEIVATQLKVHLGGLPRFHSDTPETFQLPDRASDAANKITDVHLHHLLRSDRAVV